jgi:hypothetical protein
MVVVRCGDTRKVTQWIISSSGMIEEIEIVIEKFGYVTTPDDKTDLQQDKIFWRKPT